MKRKISTILFLFIASITFAQSENFFLEANFNTFSHSKLSSFQKEFKYDIPEILLRTSDDFPSNFGFTLGYEIADINTAIFASYSTTGGKLSYSDYSGVIKVEQSLNGISFGGIYYLNLSSDKYFRVGFKGLTMLSSLDLDSYSQIGNNLNKEQLEFKSIDFGVGLQLNYEYPISFLRLKANLGYDLFLSGKLTYKRNSDLHLVNNKDKKVTTGWSGLRIGIGVAIPIK